MTSDGKLSKSAYALLALGLGVFLFFEAKILLRHTGPADQWAEKDRVAGQMIDRVVFTDTASAFAAGAMNRVKLLKDDPARIVLPEGRRGTQDFPRDGTWTSPQVVTDFPITEMVPSWNASTPDDTGIFFSVRTRDQKSAKWSPWLRIGSWGRVTDKARRDEFEFGRIDVDTLFLDRPADAYQLRATLQSFSLDYAITPALRRLTVCYSGPITDQSIAAKNVTVDPGPPERWAKDLNVPYIPQGDNDASMTDMTCSPTSVSMVLQHQGVDRPTMENCLAIWDDHNALFGNWSNATQRAAELGMDAWLQRFRNWDQVKEMIAQGQPIVASIEFEPNSFPDSPVFKPEEGTDGHLIVIRGFKPDGTVIVNDPANRSKGNGALYPAKGLAHAWFGNKGGLGYVIRKPVKPIPASLVKSPTTRVATTSPVAER